LNIDAIGIDIEGHDPDSDPDVDLEYNNRGSIFGRIRQCSRNDRSPTFEEVDMHKAPIGSVMVVGGGIAGIQAALDLADSGYYVYLVEKGPGIGGGMAKLDKTFPTNDCSM
jgi:heterodisulfide reductase subunit A